MRVSYLVHIEHVQDREKCVSRNSTFVSGPIYQLENVLINHILELAIIKIILIIN